MSVINPGKHNEERWRFWRDVLAFNLKILLGNLRDFALIPVSLGAALIDVVSKGEREGSLFYRVLRWGAHSEDVLDAYSAVKHEKSTVNPDYTIDAVIARIEGTVVREYEKGGTAASIKAALDRVIDQLQEGTSGHRERAQDALAKASEKLGRLGLPEIPRNPTKTVAGEDINFAPAANVGTRIEEIRIRRMVEGDTTAVTELAIELGYPNEVEDIKHRIERISTSDLLLVAFDSMNRVVGFIQAHQVWIIEVGFRVEILGLVVSKTARRHGVGRRLITEVEAWAKTNGAP